MTGWKTSTLMKFWGTTRKWQYRGWNRWRSSKDISFFFRCQQSALLIYTPITGLSFKIPSRAIALVEELLKEQHWCLPRSNDNVSDIHACHKGVRTHEGSVPHAGAQCIANTSVRLMGAVWQNVFSFPWAQAPDSGMGCETSFLWVQVTAQVVQSSSVTVFTALNCLGTTQPWQDQAPCKSHCVAKNCLLLHSTNSYLCFQWFCFKPSLFCTTRKGKWSRPRREGNWSCDRHQCVTRCALVFVVCLSPALAAGTRGGCPPVSSTTMRGIEGNMRRTMPKLRSLALLPCPTPGILVT